MCSWFSRAVSRDRYHSLHPALWYAKKGIPSGRWEEERAGTCHCWAFCFSPLGVSENDPFWRNEFQVQRGSLWSLKQWTVPAQHIQTGWWLCASTALSLVGKEGLADKDKGMKMTWGNLHAGVPWWGTDEELPCMQIGWDLGVEGAFWTTIIH